MAGFFLPLSGGIDSASTACIVGCMCDIVIQSCHDYGKLMVPSLYLLYPSDAQVISDVRRILRLSDDQPIPATGTDMAGYALYHGGVV